MDTPTAQRGILVRQGTDHDLLSLTQLIDNVDAKTSLPKEAHVALSCASAPSILSKNLKEDRLFIVEREGVQIGYFYIWNACDRNRWIELICAFVGSASEADVTMSFQDMYELIFRKLKMHRVTLLVNPDQLFFFTIAHNLNLILEGTLRQLFCLGSKWYDVCLFSQLADERKPERPEGVLENTRRFEWLLDQVKYDEIQILVVRAIIIRSKKETIEVLLLLRSADVPLPGLEEPPGGRVEEGESIYEALSRTVAQQTGLCIDEEIYFLTSFDFKTEEGRRVRELVFRVHPTTWDVTLGSKEYETFFWMPLPLLHKSKLHPDLIQILSSYSPTIAYEVEGVPGHEQEASIELVRPPTQQLEETLRIGHHLDAYAAKGLMAIEPFGLILRDSANRIVGGLSAEIAYGCLTIRRLWIDSSWRRLGWGKKLVTRAEAFAREKECKFVTTVVMDWEDVPFFQKLGYVIEYQYTGYAKNSRQFRFRKTLLPPPSGSV